MMAEKTTFDILTAGDDLELDDNRQVVKFMGKEFIRFPPREYELLRFFMQHPREKFTREELMQLLTHDTEMISEIRSVDQYVARLRNKLRRRFIRTIPKYGYIFEVNYVEPKSR